MTTDRSAAAAVLPSEQPRVLAGLAPEQFKLAFRHHAAGVAVVTADAGDGPVGITATSSL